jgi:hypothetical protein
MKKIKLLLLLFSHLCNLVWFQEMKSKYQASLVRQARSMKHYSLQMTATPIYIKSFTKIIESDVLIVNLKLT